MVGYLGLGSNVGDRRARLRNAVAALRGQGVSVLASSSVYETEPVGLVPDQREFLNACLRIETSREPEELLDACKAVERELGRAAGGARHGPRAIDVDVLMLGRLEYVSPRLTLPHPEILGRRFVLVPLLELDPELAVPGPGLADPGLAGPGLGGPGGRLEDALAALGPGQAVRKVGEPLATGPSTAGR